MGQPLRKQAASPPAHAEPVGPAEPGIVPVAAPGERLLLVCAWCTRVMLQPDGPPTRESHGICRDCLNAHFPDVA